MQTFYTGPEEQQEKVASSTAFLLSVAALNSAVAGSALAADKAVSSAVQGPNSVPALVSASGNQAVDKAVSTAVDAVKVLLTLPIFGAGVAGCLSHAGHVRARFKIASFIGHPAAFFWVKCQMRQVLTSKVPYSLFNSTVPACFLSANSRHL